MINYRLETLTSWDEEETGLYYWIVKIYDNSDLMNMYVGCLSHKDASEIGQSFIDGVKFARGE